MVPPDQSRGCRRPGSLPRPPPAAWPWRVQPASQPPWQTRLSPWSHIWRFTLTLGISAVAWFGVWHTDGQHRDSLFAVDLALGVVGFALLPFRRRWPMTIAVATTLLSA